MRIIIMYDLDMSDPSLVRQYNIFHKNLIRKGYMMMQYSIYIKILNAPTKKNYEIKSLKKIVPNNGNVRVLVITNQQYNNMEMIRGSKRLNETINTEKRRIVINNED